MLKVARFKGKAELLQKFLASNIGREKGFFEFQKDKDGYVILENYRIKSFLEEAARALFYEEPKKIQRINSNVFVLDAKFDPKIKPSGVFSRPVVIFGPDASTRASIIKSEYVDKGARFTFILEIVPPTAVSLDDLKMLFSYGERMGIGAWRKAGYGRFKLLELKPVSNILK